MLRDCGLRVGSHSQLQLALRRSNDDTDRTLATVENSPMNYDAYERIKVAREGRILTLTLSNPQKLNAVDGRMHRELAEIFYDVQEDAGADIVVLTGEGNAFSAGGDIDWMRRSAEGQESGPSTNEGKKIIFGLLDLEKPL